MRWTPFFVGAAALLLTAPLPAHSADEAVANDGDPKVAHAQADEDSDGQIDHEEFHHRLIEVFYFSDEDRDGTLAGHEFDRTGFVNPGAADEDSDGKLTMREFVDEGFERFSAADSNGDALLSVEEVEAAYEERSN